MAGPAPFVGKITQKAILFGPQDRVLLTRVDDHWEPPGGTFEYGETLVGGLRRELHEELALDTRVGPPVEALYGGWADDEGTPMVTLVYRCETDETDVTLNHEHDDYEWLSPSAAADRLGMMAGRLGTAVERAAAIGGHPPFEAVTDPYDGTDVATEELLAALERARRSDGSSEE